jgi:hypothetical protein
MGPEEAKKSLLAARAKSRGSRAPAAPPSQGGPRARRYWKATLRSAPLLGFVLLGKWHEEVRIFRWKWLAKAAARRHGLWAGRDTLTETIIEPYRPGENIIRLGAHPPADAAARRL